MYTRTCIITGCFYFTIANLPPRLRTKLNAIQAIAFAKSEHMSKYGISYILRCITKDIAKLEDVSNQIYNTNNVYIVTYVRMHMYIRELPLARVKETWYCAVQ